MRYGKLLGNWKYLKMIKNFESIDELYAFFVPNLIKPEKESKCTFLTGIQLNRTGWHIHILPGETTEGILVRFSQFPYMRFKWGSYVNKFTEPSQDS